MYIEPIFKEENGFIYSRPYLPKKLKPLSIAIQDYLNPNVTDSIRYAILHGGRGSGKSTGVAIIILICCMLKKQRVLCLREFMTSLAESCHQLFTDLIYDYGWTSKFDVNNNKITCLTTGAEIIFKGANRNPESLKSTQGIDLVWWEEGQQCSARSLRLLVPTIRKDKSFLIVTMNPEYKTDPMYCIFLDTEHKVYQGQKKDVLIINLNWGDNERWTKALERERLEMLETDPDEYDHVYEGKCRHISKDLIYASKFISADFETPKNAVFYQGLDFGDSHPFAFVRCFIESETNTLFIDQEAYGHKVDLEDYSTHMQHIKDHKKWLTICDSASPGSIRKLSQLGFNVEGTDKNHAPVADGIRFIRSFKRIVVHTRCTNMLNEFKSYKYKKDPKTDVVTPVIIKESDHLCDALRYSLNKLIIQSIQTPEQWATFTGRDKAKSTLPRPF